MSFREVGYLWSHVLSGGRVSLVPVPFRWVGYLGEVVGYPGGYPSGVEATAAGSTHPTGMLSCCERLFTSFQTSQDGRYYVLSLLRRVC